MKQLFSMVNPVQNIHNAAGPRVTDNPFYINL